VIDVIALQPLFERLKLFLGRPAVSWLVLGGSVLATLLVSIDVAERNRESIRLQLQQEAEHQSRNLLGKLHGYTHILIGGKALFDASDSVTATDWQQYSQSLEMDHTLPGLQAFGFSRYLGAADLSQVTQAARLGDAFRIWPQGQRERYAVVQMVEPPSAENRLLIGFDGYSDPACRTAMDHARDSGEPAMSAMVPLKLRQGGTPGIMIFVPVYRHKLPLHTIEQRRAALYGFVFGAFRARDMLQHIYDADDAKVDVQLLDAAGQGALLFSSLGKHSREGATTSLSGLSDRGKASDAADQPQITQAARPHITTVEFGGRRWEARFFSRPTLGGNHPGSLSPLQVLLIGLTGNLLLFAVLHEQIRHRREQSYVAQALRASRDRFSALVDNVPGTVFRCEPGSPWKILFMGGETEVSTGHPIGRFISGGMYYSTQIHPDDLPGIEALAYQAIRQHTGWVIEYRVRHCSGQWRWAKLHARAVYDTNGQPLFADGVIFDITAAKQAEQDLHALTDHLSVAVYRYRLEADGQPRVLYVSSAIRDLFGVSAETAMQDAGQLFQRIHPEDLPGVIAADRVASDALAEFSHEMRIVRDDGQVRWLYLNSVPQQMADGSYAYNGFIEDVTARRQAQQQLQHSEAKLRRLIDTATEGIWSIDANLCTRFVNQSLLDMLGYQAEEMLGRRIDEFLFPEDVADHQQQMALRKAGQSTRYERRARCKDGSERWFLVSARSIEDEQGRFDGSFAMVSDITAINQARQALAERESLLQQIFDTSSVGIFLVDGSGVITHANRRMAEMFHCSIEQMVGSEYVSHVHPRERHVSRQRMLALLKSEIGAVDLERLYWRADGSSFWGNLTGRRFVDPHGAEMGLLGVIADITDRHVFEEELRVAATTFQIQEGIIVTDPAGVILRVNPAFSDTTGYSAAEAVGKTPAILRSSRHDALFFREMWASLLQAGKWQGELWNRRKSGEEYPQWLAITAVRDENQRVTHYVGAFHDITERKAAEEEIRNLAFYDPLTQLPNRRLLMDRLQQGLASSARNGLYGALIFIDLDNFKTLNDTLGHDLGDQLLLAVARRLQGSVREGDTVARLGGDEFIVMLPALHASATQAAAQVELIGEKIISELNPAYQLGKHEVRSTPSLGITLFHAHEASVEELLKRADMAMYQAKAAGRNTLRFFDPQMQQRINARVELESELYQAIERHEFELYYQPQVDRSGCCVGVEALIRWPSPRRGMVSPAEFIPLAEETGQILSIGHWVLLQACEQLARWQHDPLTAGLTIAVNVSPKQFRLPVFVEELRQMLQHTAANPARLKLELTEGMLLSDIDDAITKMNAVQALGVQFSLDDFGTGYSSLSYLKQLPLNQMKIDQSFVRDILTNFNDTAICRAVIALGKSLGLRVIAEGVETEAQWTLLQAEGCDEAQGYLFARPQPIPQLETWLRSRPAGPTA
jgi:diguanylate cyclase (GGDEF)-like protein/PAS domain S-box-containing protein